MRQTEKLTSNQVERAQPRAKSYKLSDGRGLFLLVNPDGSRWWRMAYRYGGKQKTISMGVYPDVGLQEARDRLSDARRLLRDGVDPSAARKAAKESQTELTQNTFGAVATAWVAKNANTWSGSTLRQTQSRLDRDVLPYLKARPIREITAPEILKVTHRVVDRGAVETARRVLRIIQQVMTYAVVTGRLDVNPATDLGQALPTAKVKHMSALTTPDAVAGLMRAIQDYQGEPVTRAALRLAPLVFVRPGELRGATWSEFDLDAARWEIPAERMKMDAAHIVPLSSQAVEILADLQPLTGQGELVFPGARSASRPISNNTLNAALRRLGYSKDQMTAHGFRAMARTMLEEELGFRYELIEHQLAHVVRDANGRAYNRTRHLKERGRMMQAWADYLDRLRGGGGNVTELRAGA